MKRVITYGTFDLTHIGHVRLLKRARHLGDYLIVGLSTDEFNSIKGKKAIFPYEHRKEILESMRFVDLVIPEYDWAQKPKDIVDLNVDIFTMGDDWLGQFDYLNNICQVQYLARTSDISTTEIRNIIQSKKDD